MDVGNIAQFATGLANQRTNTEVGISVAKLANDSVSASGQAAVELIQAVPKPQGSLGHHINVTA